MALNNNNQKNVFMKSMKKRNTEAVVCPFPNKIAALEFISDKVY